MALRGCDLSHWNNDSQYESCFKYADFFIFKATESINMKDKKCKSRIEKCIKNGKRVGLYHFWQNTNYEQQFDNFDTIYNKYYMYAVPIIDVEIKYVNWMDVMLFINLFYYKYHVFPLIYVDNERYKQLPTFIKDNCDIWVARYNNTLTFNDIKQLYPLAVGWQYTNKGSFSKENIKVDCSYFFEDVFLRHIKVMDTILTKVK